MCFFFKQKTAYEMRISDWSSDVCSSDLSSVRKIVEMQDEIDTVNDVMTTQLGPEHVIVALSAEFRDELTTSQIERCVARLEARIRDRHPEVQTLFIKPQKPAAGHRDQPEASRSPGAGDRKSTRLNSSH